MYYEYVKDTDLKHAGKITVNSTEAGLSFGLNCWFIYFETLYMIKPPSVKMRWDTTFPSVQQNNKLWGEPA